MVNEFKPIPPPGIPHKQLKNAWGVPTRTCENIDKCPVADDWLPDLPPCAVGKEKCYIEDRC